MKFKTITKIILIITLLFSLNNISLAGKKKVKKDFKPTPATRCTAEELNEQLVEFIKLLPCLVFLTNRTDPGLTEYVNIMREAIKMVEKDSKTRNTLLLHILTTHPLSELPKIIYLTNAPTLIPPTTLTRLELLTFICGDGLKELFELIKTNKGIILRNLIKEDKAKDKEEAREFLRKPFLDLNLSDTLRILLVHKDAKGSPLDFLACFEFPRKNALLLDIIERFEISIDDLNIPNEKIPPAIVSIVFGMPPLNQTEERKCAIKLLNTLLARKSWQGDNIFWATEDASSKTHRPRFMEILFICGLLPDIKEIIHTKREDIGPIVTAMRAKDMTTLYLLIALLEINDTNIDFDIYFEGDTAAVRQERLSNISDHKKKLLEERDHYRRLMDEREHERTGAGGAADDTDVPPPLWDMATNKTESNNKDDEDADAATTEYIATLFGAGGGGGGAPSWGDHGGGGGAAAE